MARTKTFVFDGIEYEMLNRLTWGEELEVAEEVINDAVRIEDLVAGKENVKNVLNKKIDVSKMTIKSVARSVKRWTFRGYNEDDSLRMDGDILPLTEENIKQIPGKHGHMLTQFVEGKDALTEYERKN